LNVLFIFFDLAGKNDLKIGADLKMQAESIIPQRSELTDNAE
jgi:hypothetical protein